MRFSTVVISSAFVLAGMSAARFAGSDFEVEARAFDEEPELYARGGAMSKLTGGNKPPSYRTAARDPLPRYEGSPNHVPHLDSFRTETDYSHNHKLSSSTSRHRRRSYYPSNDYELVARGKGHPKIGDGQPLRQMDVTRSPHINKDFREQIEIKSRPHRIDVFGPSHSRGDVGIGSVTSVSPTKQKKRF
ncbi:hypothetical protein M378DRAFT_164797 [Amanita muscaria Koide BX008]|uniref:Uncharacterized protein n=1 Tax=Amanita muscaria (strain Koide BX008) TaxID=946122 RepID=A0A0C2T8Y5_AMAMK|nr:hypothetical protein M378DRAFT_164797 [Amanita muscaria Koide BX008]